jgi:hypothetical protein
MDQVHLGKYHNLNSEYMPVPVPVPVLKFRCKKRRNTCRGGTSKVAKMIQQKNEKCKETYVYIGNEYKRKESKERKEDGEKRI